jgi:hypothetical protein
MSLPMQVTMLCSFNASQRAFRNLTSTIATHFATCPSQLQGRGQKSHDLELKEPSQGFNAIVMPLFNLIRTDMQSSERKTH